MDMLLGMRNRFHMQVHPVPVFKLHQPAIEILFIACTVRAFIRILHIQDIPEPANPLLVLDKRFRFSHHKHNIIILENILCGIGIRP